MNDQKKMQSLSVVAALIVLAVFAVGVLWVLLGGIRAYTQLTQRDQAAFESRSVSQYLATKVRQISGSEAVSVAPFGEGQALVIAEVVDGDMYLTRIYCYDGWLMELYSPAGNFTLADGEKLLPLRGLELSLDGRLLTATYTQESGVAQTQQLWIRGTGEVSP